MTLSCEFPTNKAKVLNKIYWLKDGKKIVSKSFPSGQFTIYSNRKKTIRLVGQASLFLFSGDRHDQGMYSCHAYYLDGTIPQKNITLFVEGKIFISFFDPFYCKGWISQNCEMKPTGVTTQWNILMSTLLCLNKLHFLCIFCLCSNLFLEGEKKGLVQAGLNPTTFIKQCLLFPFSSTNH